MRELRLATLGSVDSGKTTTASVIAGNTDDGNGSAREKVMVHQHEKESGRTSFVAHIYNPDNTIKISDLCGHEKYARMTINGAISNHIDYILFIVAANAGVQKITKSHLQLAAYIRIPIIVVITKIDLYDHKETYNEVKYHVKKKNIAKFIQPINNITTCHKMQQIYSNGQYEMCPVFCISNKTGQNVELLKMFIQGLKIPEIPAPVAQKNIFRIHRVYNVKGIGTVLSGFQERGYTKKNMYYLQENSWQSIAVKSIHNDLQTNIEFLTEGHFGCLAIRSNKHNRRYNLIGNIVSDEQQKLCKKILVDLYITINKTITLKNGSNLVFVCRQINQTVTLQPDKIVRCGDRTQVKLKFDYPVYVENGYEFVLRDSDVRAIGRIISKIN